MYVKLTESLWVMIEGGAGTGDIIVGISCRKTECMKPSIDIYEWPQCSQALVLMGDFNHPN